MAYLQYREITIDHLEVPNTDQTDFPVLISGTYSYLATIANGGKVNSSNGYDIAFYADSGLTDQLSHEVESYNATTGEVIFWVKVPTVSHSVDTTIYLAYGNVDISTSQENINDVWSNNFREVFHIKDGTTLIIEDSTSLGNDPGSVASLSAVNAKIGGGASSGVNSIANGFSSNLSPSGNSRTITAWVKRDNSTRGGIISTRPANGTQGWVFTINFGNVAGRITYFNTGGAIVNITSSLAQDTWGYVTATWDGTEAEVFLNGTSLGTATGNSDNASGINGQIFCETTFGGVQHPLRGDLDEVRIAHTIRSSDWLTTEYNNQNNPSKFYRIGAEIPISVAETNFMFWFTF